MALIGRVVGYVEICSGGKVLHDLMRHTPNNLSSISSDKVHACDLISGHRGGVGSTIVWHYTLDGKKQTAKEIIEEVDEKDHKIVFKVIGGKLVEEMYKAFKVIFHYEIKDGKKFGIWTLEFEKPNTSVPYPTSLLDFLSDLLKNMDEHASSTK